MAPKSKKKLILKTVSVVDIGCGNCRKPNFSSIFNPFPKKPKLSSSNYRHCHSSSSSTVTTANTTTTSFSDTSSSSPFFNKTPSTPLSTAAVAVEKDSDDPYLDFRQSMLQMILENQIYSKEDLRELLHCFLRLNSQYHHAIIVRAFSEIWEDVSSSTTATATASAAIKASPLVSRHVSRASRDYYNYY